MKAYTTINYIDLSLEEVDKLSKRIYHTEGRNNGLLFNGKIILSVPMDSNEFTIEGYLKAFPDIVNCENDFNKFKDIVNYEK
jgi:hypothetical protein